MRFIRNKEKKLERDLVRYAVDYPFSPAFGINQVRTDAHTEGDLAILYSSQIQYGQTAHYVALRRCPQGRLSWYVEPYNGAFFETPATIPESFTVAVQAILDHTDIHHQ